MIAFRPLAALGCQVGESPVWDERRDVLFVCDVIAHAIYRIALDGTVEGKWRFDQTIGSFGLTESGRLVVAHGRDIVLFDPEATRTLRATDLHHTSDYTPYEGLAVRGAVRDVLVRGADVIRGGTFVGRRGAGQFIERGPIAG